MIKIVVFLNTTSDIGEKPKIMCNIVESLDKNRYEIIYCKGDKYIECDIGIMFAYFCKKNLKNNKKDLYKYNLLNKLNCKWIFIDTDPLNSISKNNDKNAVFFRLSFGSIFIDEMIKYVPENVSNERWNIICNIKNIHMKEYRKTGEYIFIPLQTNNSFSMKGINIYQWLNNTIEKIREFTDKKILIRLKTPNERDDVKEIIKKFINIDFHVNDNSIPKQKRKHNLESDLNNAWVTVLYTTSIGIPSLLYGIPVISLNPSSLVYDISDHDLSFINNPTLYDRESFFYKFSYYVWNIPDLKTGRFWNFLEKNYINEHIKL